MLKTIDDYLPLLYEMYPDIPKDDIKRAVRYGWRQMYFYNLRGLDTLIQSQKHKYWFYCGYLTKNSLTHFSYYCKMLRRKFRVLYTKKYKEWDNIYYFGLNLLEYEELIKPKRGRKKTHWIFKKKMLFKILDEAKVAYSWALHIVAIKYPVLMGYQFYKETLKCEVPEIVFERDKPDTFEDILVTSKNYDLI